MSWVKQVTQLLWSLMWQRWKILLQGGTSQVIVRPDVSEVRNYNRPQYRAANILNDNTIYLKGNPCTEEGQREPQDSSCEEEEEEEERSAWGSAGWGGGLALTAPLTGLTVG